MLEISESDLKRITRRQWARLWGQKSLIKPYFVEQAFGDGAHLVAITPLNTRPNYYLIRVDSQWSMRNTDENCMAEHIDEVCEAIEEEVGSLYGEDDNGEECRLAWPALDDSSGVSWCTAMDLLGLQEPSRLAARATPVAKEE